MMRNKPSLTKLSNSPYEWKVRYRDGGKIRFKYFKSGEKKVAEQFVKKQTVEAENHGNLHESITGAERAALIKFRDSIVAMPDPKPTLDECISSFLQSIASRLCPITVSELVAKRANAAQTKGVHERTLRDLVGTDGTKGKLGAFAGTFGTRQASSITAEDVELWVNAQCASDSNRREMLVRLRGLFAYGIKRRYITQNPIDQLELPRPSAARAAILSVKECAKLLTACPARSLPAVAVQLFAGLRHAEAERLMWQDVDFEHGSIKACQRKGAGNRREKNRFIPLTPALRAWLGPHRKKAGTIFPTGRTGEKASPQAYRKDFAAARVQAGITTWDENTLRHCFGSYRTAGIRNLEQVRLEMGHSTSRTTYEHYLNAVAVKEAESFWNLRPADNA